MTERKMILDSNSKKPNIIYPCDWDYKVIGTDIDEMIKAIEQIVEAMDYKISSSSVSAKGNYFSLNLKVFVTSEIIRDIIFAKLKANKFVKIVL
jgi:putative lipoic acid-binding regulatory protein